MRRRDTRTPVLPPPETVDALYGLEPVLEPGQGTDEADGTRFELIQCPYCGENYQTLLDLSAGSADYIEDCQVCCQPIELSVEVDARGRLDRLTPRRCD